MLSTELDAIDWKILDRMQGDARIANVKLAEAVHLSPSPCLARVRELLHAAPAAESQSPDGDAEIEPAKPCFVCLHCGAAMLVLQIFTRGQSIRAPPRRPHAP